MARYIFKLQDKKGNAYYGEWSSVVDAPVSYLMPLYLFTEYYEREYGRSGMRDLPERMERVEEKGTSAFMYDSVDELISGNRAGKNEACIRTKEGLLKKYKLSV